MHTVCSRAVPRILENGAVPVRTTSAVATEVIREAIIDGRLAPGERLKEQELASELGLSRTPIREALAVLQAEGLVDMVPNRGATVRSHDASDLDDLYRLRALLEGYTAGRAAARVTDQDVSALVESCERFEALADGEIGDIVKENLFFHNLILESAGSERAGRLVRNVIELPLVYKSYIFYSPEQRRISAHYHWQITRAIRARDAERAELVMKEHIFEARDLLVSHVRELEGAAQ